LEDKISFIDFETTGFSQNRALSLAIVHYYKGTRVEKYYLINPNAIIESGAFRIHGITYEMIADKPSFNKIWHEIRPYIEGSLVVAHNANFDVRVLLGELDRYDLECGQFNYFCTCSNARLLNLPVRDHKLDTLSSYFGLGFFNHHNALDDAIACENIYQNLMKIGGRFTTYRCIGRQSPAWA
jgi:DNA polymerase-3 subunit epsilon